MSFFDLIEKEKVFLNEYLLFQKNRNTINIQMKSNVFLKLKK